MGTSIYSLRSDTRSVDGIKIARYGFSHQDGWDSRGALTRAFSVGERAIEKIGADVTHFIMGDWETVGAEGCAHPTYVYKKTPTEYRPTLSATCSDTGLRQGERIVGILFRRGRKLMFREQPLEIYEAVDAIVDYIEQLIPLLDHSVLLGGDMPLVYPDTLRHSPYHRETIIKGLKWIDSIPAAEMDRITSTTTLTGFDRDWMEDFLLS